MPLSVAIFIAVAQAIAATMRIITAIAAIAATTVATTTGVRWLAWGAPPRLVAGRVAAAIVVGWGPRGPASTATAAR